VVTADIDAGITTPSRSNDTPALTPGTVKANKTAEAITSEGGTATVVPGVITNSKDISNLVQKASDVGAGNIHTIINNAGYAWDDPIEKPQDKQWSSTSLSPTALHSVLIPEDTIFALHSTLPSS
jgi:3-oxoacyl-[acyl-carrier protein] reductase